MASLTESCNFGSATGCEEFASIGMARIGLYCSEAIAMGIDGVAIDRDGKLSAVEDAAEFFLVLSLPNSLNSWSGENGSSATATLIAGSSATGKLGEMAVAFACKLADCSRAGELGKFADVLLL